VTPGVNKIFEEQGLETEKRPRLPLESLSNYSMHHFKEFITILGP
jgi:hypothetical protein